jgi:uncharacterized surface protein with fasciclin (FAS1) repeats
MMLKLRFLVIAGIAVVAGAAQAAGSKDIVDIAAGAPNFKTLVSLVQKADLVKVLKGKGPFTVLAPTDAAFAKLPKSLVATIVGDKKLLTTILTYHVIAGNVFAKDLKDGAKPKTVQGETVTVSIKDGKVQFNSSTVVAADIKASNGVIHAIDTVLVPPSVLAAMAKKHH